MQEAAPFVAGTPSAGAGLAKWGVVHLALWVGVGASVLLCACVVASDEWLAHPVLDPCRMRVCGDLCVHPVCVLGASSATQLWTSHGPLFGSVTPTSR